LELEGSRGVGAEMVLEFTYMAILTRCAADHQSRRHQDLKNAFVIGGRMSLNF
jgi:hypothetical protein